MNPPDKADYIQYRLQKSEETFEAARLLIENQQWNSAINRLYYAIFYAVSALLAKTDIETKTHSGIKSQFLAGYIKTGKIEMRLGKVYSDLFDWRQKGDYGDFFDFTKEDVTSILTPARELLDVIIMEVKR